MSATEEEPESPGSEWILAVCERSRQARSCGITERELPTQPGKVRKCFPEMATMSQDKKDVTIRRKSRASSGPNRDAWR